MALPVESEYRVLVVPAKHFLSWTNAQAAVAAAAVALISEQAEWQRVAGSGCLHSF